MARTRTASGVFGKFTKIFPEPVLENRAPTASDTNFELMQRWLDQSVNNVYTLVSLALVAEVKTATWQVSSSAASELNTLTGNSGGVISPDGANNIDLLGGVNGGVTLVGTANTLTSSLVNTVVVPNTSIASTTPLMQFDGLSAGAFAGSERGFQQGSANIAAVTTAIVHSITLADPNTITVLWTFSASLDPATEAGGGTVTATARRSGGGAILLGVPVVAYNSDFAGADSVTAVVSGNDIQLEYTTGTNGPVNLVAFASFQPLISNA